MVSEHGTSGDSSDGAEADLKGTGDGAFTCSDDVVLGEGEDGGDVGVGARDCEEGSEEFDAVGDGGGDEGKSDDCDEGMGEDEGGSVVDFVGPVGGDYSDDGG